MNILIPRLNPCLFDWLRWTGASIHDLGIFCRYEDITSDRGIKILRKHAIGYCPAKRLNCRPKYNGEIAIMCVKEDERIWFHLRKEEFYEVFNDN